MVFLGAFGAAAAGIAGLLSACVLRIPSGGRSADIALSLARALAESTLSAVAGAGALFLSGAVITATVWIVVGPPSVWIDVGAALAVIGPLACIFAARRSRALTRTAALVMQYELGFPAGLRDHDAALESALAAELKNERALRRYAAARERVLRRMRPRPH